LVEILSVVERAEHAVAVDVKPADMRSGQELEGVFVARARPRDQRILR
jgi:hypothetical protein